MGMHSWRGASQKEYPFATYPIILPMDVASVARFYIGRPVLYAFCTTNALGQTLPLYFGHAEDGYQRLYLDHHGATAAALSEGCTELHVMQLGTKAAEAQQSLADLLAAHPARLNTPVFSNAGPRANSWARTA